MRLLPSLGAVISLGWCAFGFAQSEPQPLPPDVEARPINEAGATTSNVLRWKSKPRASASEYVASDESNQPINQEAPKPLRAGWNITRIDPSVRQAKYAPDPFSDPFGDRKASNNEPSLILQPTQAESGIEELPAPRTLSPIRRAAPANSSLTAAQQPGVTPAPFGSPLNERSSTPCPERTYNDRNCCDDEASCHEFRNRLLSDSIRNISLDITPRLNPDLTPEEDEVDQNRQRLRLLEVRPWRDRRGNVIATGKMMTLQFNTVVLADESGKETGRISISELGEDELCYVTAWWRLPKECPLGGLRTNQRNWLASTFHYNASGLCHKPLYFEDVQLERYGHTAGPFRQPILSGAHFVISLASLPYQMAINPPTECQYALGYYRPGDCAPWMIQPIPLSLRGAAAEIAVALGMIYIIP